MSDPTPPGDAGGPVKCASGPLTPDAIDAVLSDFRTWLEDLVNPPEAPVADAPGSPAVDLATVVAAFTALRHEVNLQTKAARANRSNWPGSKSLNCLPPKKAMSPPPAP